MPEPLFPFQEFGAQWLASSPHAFLADEMRVGKTPQAIRACDLVGAERILVLCPAIARQNWEREFKKFSRSNRTYSVWNDSATCANSNVVICSYDLTARNKVRSSLLAVDWHVVILDEAHYLKTANTKRTQVAYHGLKSARFWCLSGTPAPNHAGELLSHLRHAGLWHRSDDEYRDTYTVEEVYQVKTKYGWIPKTKIVGSKNIPQLKALIAPYFLRRKLMDVAKDLPPMLFSDVVVEATEPDMHVWCPTVTLKIDTPEYIHKQIDDENAAIQAILDLTGKGEAGSDALAALQSAKTTTSRRWVGLQKVPKIAELITEELNAGAYAKIVLFAWHRDVIKFLHLKLRPFHPQIVYGGTPAMARDLAIRKFKEHGAVRVFIGQIQAAGVAIDLSIAHEVAFVEASWVPGENAQAAMRVHHLKQTNPVRVRFFSVANSVDERVQAILRRKTRDLTALFDETSESEVAVANPFH